MKDQIFHPWGEVRSLVQKIRSTIDLHELIHYETILTACCVFPIELIGSATNFYFRLTEREPWLLTWTTTLLMAALGFASIMTIALNLTDRIRIHLLCSFGSLFVLLRIFPDFSTIGSMPGWFFLFIMTLIAVTRVDRILLIYTGITAISFCVLSSVQQFFLNGSADTPVNVLRFVLVGVVFIVGIVVQKIYADLLKRDLHQVTLLHARNEEITQLNQDLLQSKEALKSKNSQLSKSFMQIKENEKKLIHLANFDNLTDLPNRKLFMESLVRLCRRASSAFAVIFIDLDKFKAINDTMGHYIGDRFLKTAAKRATAVIGEKDILGRLGGDEFALIVPDYSGKESLLEKVNQLLNILEQPFQIDKYKITSSASFGISIFPHHAVNAAELLKAADTTLYKVKEIGKSRIQFFDDQMQEELINVTKIESALKTALERGEFFLQYQPQFDINRNRISGFEALIRWERPDHEIISPSVFIPIAERTGLISDIGQWVLKEACRKIRNVNEKVHQEINIAVNVSPVQMRDVNFSSQVKDILADEGIRSDLIELEITESILIENIDQAVASIKALKETGVHISLDDFGKGYSSLNYLKVLPIDTLKIDMSLIKGLDVGTVEKKIVGSIIALTHDLGILVVSEGVENQGQLDYLRSRSCDIIQGFLIGQPMPENAVNQFVASQKDYHL